MGDEEEDAAEDKYGVVLDLPSSVGLHQCY